MALIRWNVGSIQTWLENKLNMKVVVTGGAGYIGTELVKTLSQNPEVKEIIVYDNLARDNHNFFIGHKPDHHNKIKFYRGDILDSRSLRKVVADADIVYHLAAKVTTPFANSDSHFFEQVNHWGTAELVYALEESQVKRVIFASSASVYGSSTESADEEKEPNPRTFYGTSKLRAEEQMRRISALMDVYILRLGNVYGYSKSMRFDAVINKFVFEANFSRRITIHGDGKQSRSFIHIDLVASALNNLINSGLKPGTYNLVEHNKQVIEIVDVLKSQLSDLEFIFINQHLKLRQLHVKENQEVNQALGIQSHKTFEVEIAEFLDRFSF